MLRRTIYYLLLKKSKTLFTAAGKLNMIQSIEDMKSDYDSVMTQATTHVYENLSIRSPSPESSVTTVTDINDADNYDHLNRGFDDPAPYDTLTILSTQL